MRKPHPVLRSVQVSQAPYGTDDNSPVMLPDGRIVSLVLPVSNHQIKLTAADGSGAILLTGSSVDVRHEFVPQRSPSDPRIALVIASCSGEGGAALFGGRFMKRGSSGCGEEVEHVLGGGIERHGRTVHRPLCGEISRRGRRR